MGKIEYVKKYIGKDIKKNPIYHQGGTKYENFSNVLVHFNINNPQMLGLSAILVAKSWGFWSTM